MGNVERWNRGEWWKWLSRSGTELAEKSKRPGNKGQKGEKWEGRNGKRSAIRRSRESEKIKGRSGFGYKPIRDDSNKKYGV